VAGDVLGEHHGLFPQRRDQAVDFAAVLRALPDRVDVVVDRAQLVVHDDPRSTVSPETTPSPTLGRIPAVTTTMAQSIVDRSAKSTPVTVSSYRMAVSRTPVWTVMPSLSTERRSTCPAWASSCWFISSGADWTTCTSSPFARSPCAASSPSRPPVLVENVAIRFDLGDRDVR
jgi:hypothetical protein